MQKRYVCPLCKERGGVDILYGMPSTKAFEMEQRGELALGGCCVDEGAPERRCPACGHEWMIKRRLPEWPA